MNIRELFGALPIITAAKNEEGLSHAIETDSTAVFILYGTVLDIQKIVGKVRDHGKLVIVHVDLIVGFSLKEVVIDFIRENTSADGIIGTKPILARHATELGLIGGQRTSLIDSMILDNMRKQPESFRSDLMELIPGVMPGALRIIRQVADIPLVVGGLLSDKRGIMVIFDVGVDAVSTTKKQLWYMQG